MSAAYKPSVEKGEFRRAASSFRDWVKADGSTPYQPEAGRYHLYVSLACPWAHRTLIVRALKGLEDVIGVSVVHWLLESDGWSFHEGRGVIPDPVHNVRLLRELYHRSDSGYTGRITVPVLWDKKTDRIVSNESSEIIRMLNSEFNALAKNPSLDLYPEPLRAKIDDINSWVYDTVNNGVYRSGFATSQEAYDTAVHQLFSSLERLEDILSRSRFLVGDRITEADVRLWTTLVRFDPVYHGHFKCNKFRIVDKPNLLGFLRELYQVSAFSSTTDAFHIKHHYYESHRSVNPTGVVPVGDGPDLEAPHGRDALGGRSAHDQLTNIDALGRSASA